MMIYEQPLNEQIRLCLRLEYLFSQVNYFISRDSSWDIHQSLKIIIEILQTIDRPDLKNKFFQILNQYSHILTKLKNIDGVDLQKLHDTIVQIDRLINSLHSNQKRIGQELKDNALLNAIQQRLQIPAGTCSFNLPAYHLWIQQVNFSKQQLIAWLGNFDELQEITNIILKLIRDSSIFNYIETQDGFYQIGLDPNIPYQLIRIILPNEINVFPEISVGKHRLTVHFFNLKFDGNYNQVSNQIAFEISCCKI